MFFGRLAAGLLCLSLMACAQEAERSAPAPSTPRAGGTLVLTNLADVDSVNDLISNGAQPMREVERLLFLELAFENADLDQGPATFSPRLAERWEFSDDRRTLTFHLREATWSDGVPITADDVRWTWQAQTNPDVAWRNRRQKEVIEDVEVVDAGTVRFHFAEASTDQLDIANLGAILPKHAWGGLPFPEWRASGGWFAEHIVTSGPFVLESWTPNQELVFGRNERYYESGLPRVERVLMRVIPEKNGQISQLLGGSVDYVQVVPPDQIGRIESHPDTVIDAYWGRQYDYLCWNTRREPLGSAAVRRALTQAIDRQTIIDSIYRGYARVGISGVLSWTWGFDSRLEPWPYARDEAERALSQAGYEDLDGDGVRERDGERLAFELLIQNGNRVHLDAATLIQAQLARAGVEITQRPVEFQTWVQKVIGGDFEVAIGGWEISTSLDMSFSFHTREIGNYNFGAYSNPELDRLMEAARAASSVDEKRGYLHQVQALLHRDQPYTFLWEPQRLNARRQRVRDSRPNFLTSFYNIDEWWLAE